MQNFQTFYIFKQKVSPLPTGLGLEDSLRWPTTATAKEITSQQKKNFMAKEITLQQKE